jgi:phage tail sheath gpL-like
MSISFNSIPAGTRVPFCYVEFDSSNAVSGASVMPWKSLLVGQKIAGGTATANVPVRVKSAAQAVTLFGDGSILAGMCAAFIANNKSTELWAVPQDDAGGSVAATGTLTVAGTATASGSLTVTVGGKSVSVAVASGDAATVVATAIKNALSANNALPVTATVATAVVTVTAKNKGVCGNSIAISYADAPAGITVAVVAMASGATNPTLSTAIAAIGDSRYNAIGFPYTDATNLTAIESELANRWGPLTQNDGHAFTAAVGDDVTAATLGTSRNSPHVSIANINGSASPVWEIVGAIVGTVSYYAAIDPARPLQTLPLSGIAAPAISDRYTQSERNVLLNSGIATLIVDDGGVVRIERMITTYRKNALGADDVSMLDYETKATLSYLRYDFRNYFLRKYPRHKLASDGIKLAAGQAILTPKIAKAEAIAVFRNWEKAGLVENVAQFKNDLIVERSESDTGRLEFLLPPDLVNQLRVTAAKIAFLL